MVQIISFAIVIVCSICVIVAGVLIIKWSRETIAHLEAAEEDWKLISGDWQIEDSDEERHNRTE